MPVGLAAAEEACSSCRVLQAMALEGAGHTPDSLQAAHPLARFQEAVTVEPDDAATLARQGQVPLSLLQERWPSVQQLRLEMQL